MFLVGTDVPLLLLAALIAGHSSNTEIVPSDAVAADVLATALRHLAETTLARGLRVREPEATVPTAERATAADLLLGLFSRLVHQFLVSRPGRA